MGVTVSSQTYVFLGSLVLGGVLGLVYDAFRISRLAFPLPVWVVLVEDLLFSACAAVATFAYMLTAVEGQVRFFVLMGEGLGLLFYELSLGVGVMGAAQAIITFFRRLGRLCYRVFGRPLLWVYRGIARVFGKITKKIHSILKKYAAKAKFRLKERRILLYNHFNSLMFVRKPGKRRWKRPNGKKRKEETRQEI